MGSAKSKEDIVLNQASDGDASSICGNKIFKEKLEDDRKKRNIQKLFI